MIVLRTLGESVVEVGRTAIAPDADTVFAALVYLAAERGRHIPRSQLAELLWPGASASRARHSLRQLLYRLRALGVGVEATRERVCLPESRIAPTFSAAPSRERLLEARARGPLVIGPYLPGYAPTFSAPFREWLDGYRDVIGGHARRALLDAAHEHQLRGEWAEVDALARECLRIDPLNETATLLRAQCAALVGARSEALSILDRYSLDLGPDRADLARPAAALRKRIAEQFPARRYTIPSDSCFVGRAELMSVLTLALLRSRNREGSSILLWGPPGIGKTRLTQELTSVAHVQNHRVVRVQCEESDARQPMATWVDAVPQLLRLSGALGVSPEAMPFLRRLTEFDPTAREPSPEARDPQYLAGRIRQAIVDLVDAVAGEGAVLLVFEDVHWMDGSSWAALRTLVEWNVGKSVQILMTSRRPHATPTPPQREVARLEVHEVGALDGAASAALVRAIADDFGGPLPAGADTWCCAVGEGNALFLRELAVHCLEGGVPRAVPPSVQTLLDARIARLRPAARRVLQASAVLGEQSTVDRLDRALEMPAHDLIGALDELTEATLILSAGILVKPRHELVAARVAAATSEASRRVLERRAAVVLEAEVERGAPVDVMWACAGHWQATGDAGRGLQLALSVANQFIEVGSPEEALNICERVDDLCVLRTDWFLVQRTRASAASHAGKWLAAAEILTALQAAERSDVTHAVWANDAIASVEAQTMASGFTLEAGNDACRLAADRGVDDAARLRAAMIALRVADNLRADELGRTAYEATRDIDFEIGGLLISGLNIEMVYHLSMGDLAQGCAAARRLTQAIHAVGVSYRTIGVVVNLTDAARICGDLEGARKHAKLAYDSAVRCGAGFFAVRAAHNALEIELESGNVVAAQHWYDQMLHRSTFVDDTGTQYELQHLLARLYLLYGDAPRAFVLAETILQTCRIAGTMSSVRTRAFVTTLVEAMLESTHDAIDENLLSQLHEIHHQTRHRTFHDRAVRALFRGLTRNGRDEEAAEVLDEYLRIRRGIPTTRSRFLFER